MSTRTTPIATTLKGVREGFRFLKITQKEGGGYAPTRVQIAGNKATFTKNKNIVYSPATGLAGTKEDILDFLRSRADRNDESAEQVTKDFKADKGLITHDNVDKHADYITNIGLSRQNATAETSSSKIELIDREKIPDLLEHVRKVRQVVSGGKTPRTNIVHSYLDVVAENPSKVFRVHGCAPDGNTTDGRRLRSAARDEISHKSTIFLGDTAPLNGFCIPASYDEKRYVQNFMSLYYMYTEGLKSSEANAKARTFAESLLAPHKKTRGRKVSPTRSTRSSRSGRSSSPKKASSVKKSSASSSPRRSGSPKKVSSPKSGVTTSPRRGGSPKRSGSPKKSVSPKRSGSPKKSGGNRSLSTVSSKGSSGRGGRGRSRSPTQGSTSPKAAPARSFRVGKLPDRKR